jgi:hypothetical protein
LCWHCILLHAKLPLFVQWNLRNFLFTHVGVIFDWDFLFALVLSDITQYWRNYFKNNLCKYMNQSFKKNLLLLVFFKSNNSVFQNQQSDNCDWKNLLLFPGTYLSHCCFCSIFDSSNFTFGWSQRESVWFEYERLIYGGFGMFTKIASTEHELYIDFFILQILGLINAGLYLVSAILAHRNYRGI